jgi:hypothetical protein
MWVLLCAFLAADTSNNQQARSNASVFSAQADAVSQITGKTSFAVPAPPPLAAGEKTRRLSDGEHFRQPNVTVGGHATVQKQLQEAQTQAQAQVLADLILKVRIYAVSRRPFSRSSVVLMGLPTNKIVGCQGGCEENDLRSGTEITSDLSAARAISDDQSASE